MSPPPLYDYKGYSPQGKPLRGVVESDSPKSARQKLKKQGIMVSEMSEKSAAKPSANSVSVPFFGSRIGGKDIALMTRQLASLVKANIPLVEALTALVDQTERDALKLVLSKVRDDVNEGSSLAKALASHPRAFDTIFVNMVEAGESSGTLGLVLVRLADLKEAQMRLRGKIVTGMTYPGLMMGVAMILMIVIFTFVIPKLTQIMESMNKPIPPVTRALMVISDSVVSYWYLLIVAGFLAAWMFRKYINTQSGRERWDRFKLSAPVIGVLLRLIAITRFATTMGTLLKSGVPILTAMSIARNLVGNTLIARAVDNAKENITEGQSIAEPLRRSGEFPPMVIHMIAIGEKTGELPDMLRNVAETYEEQVNARIESMTALLEPLMIIGMGGVVGFIVMAVFIPLMDISNIQR